MQEDSRLDKNKSKSDQWKPAIQCASQKDSADFSELTTTHQGGQGKTHQSHTYQSTPIPGSSPHRNGSRINQMVRKPKRPETSGKPGVKISLFQRREGLGCAEGPVRSIKRMEGLPGKMSSSFLLGSWESITGTTKNSELQIWLPKASEVVRPWRCAHTPWTLILLLYHCCYAIKGMIFSPLQL